MGKHTEILFSLCQFNYTASIPFPSVPKVSSDLCIVLLKISITFLKQTLQIVDFMENPTYRSGFTYLFKDITKKVFPRSNIAKIDSEGVKACTILSI